MATCNDCICFNSCYWAVPDDEKQVCEDFDDRTNIQKIITEINYEIPLPSYEDLQQLIVEEGVEDIVSPSDIQKYFIDEMYRVFNETIERERVNNLC